MVALPSRKLALIVEYNGTQYHGFQAQAGVPTIQDEIERVLAIITGERIRITSAGRTDTGVHARGQVISLLISVRLSVETLIRALNFYLPEDISIKWGSWTRSNFNARRNAISREYRYSIHNSCTPSPLQSNYTYFMPSPLNINAMNTACEAVIGRHDFASFTAPTTRSTVRIVSKAQVTREGETVFFDVVANSFLHKQVRSIIGLLTKVGLGKLSVEKFTEILKAKKPGLAGPVAPACGLCMMKVNYPAHEFNKGRDK